MALTDIEYNTKEFGATAAREIEGISQQFSGAGRPFGGCVTANSYFWGGLPFFFYNYVRDKKKEELTMNQLIEKYKNENVLTSWAWKFWGHEAPEPAEWTLETCIQICKQYNIKIE